MKTIITTTGISLYNNTRREQKEKNPKQVADPTEEQMRQYLRQNPESASAEANSLLKMAEAGDSLVFLTTATTRAQSCANLLKHFFVDKGFHDVTIRNLEFQDREEHIEKQGIRSLLSVLDSEITKAQKKQREVVINATAGFKAQVVYSTMLGMIYRVPVQYIHEEFNRVVTFSPVALGLDISLFINYKYFFEWIEDAQYSHQQNEVEAQLSKLVYDEDERARIRSFLEPVDATGEVYLAPMAVTLFRQADKYEEESYNEPDPPSSGITDIDQKISLSVLDKKHHFPDKLLEACRKIARLDYVKQVNGGHFSNTTRSRMGTFTEDGMIRVHWADNQKTALITIYTTAEGQQQTIKVRKQIQELLEIR